VLRYAEQPGPNGAKLMQHQADMFLYTDSIGASIAAKVVGTAAPKMAEQCVTQMQMFFSGMAWYVHRYPDRAATLLMTSRADASFPRPRRRRPGVLALKKPFPGAGSTGRWGASTPRPSPTRHAAGGARKRRRILEHFDAPVGAPPVFTRTGMVLIVNERDRAG